MDLLSTVSSQKVMAKSEYNDFTSQAKACVIKNAMTF